MKVTREEAVAKLHEWTETKSLRSHARAVEVVMRAAALRYGGGESDVETWGLAGMLHDADYEKWPDEHPKHIVEWLLSRGEDEMAHAISAHYSKWGIAHESELDKALIACDELTGLIVAACLVRPTGVVGLGAKSIKKKLKDKAFAAKVDRAECRLGVELLGADMGEHIDFIVAALAPHAEELGLQGRGES